MNPLTWSLLLSNPNLPRRELLLAATSVRKFHWYYDNHERALAWRREYEANYRAANRERLREWRAEYNSANHEQQLKYMRKYRALNRERILEYRRNHRQSPQHQEAWRTYAAANREKIRRYQRDWARESRAAKRNCISTETWAALTDKLTRGKHAR